VQKTLKPPLYLQQPGHSMTVVGLECHTDGSRHLLVFDPSFGPSPPMRRLAEGSRERLTPGQIDRAMKIYRRGAETLGRYQSFEVLA